MPEPTPQHPSEPAGEGVADCSYARSLEEQREPALRFALRLTGDLHEAEEAVQDAFVGLLQSPGAFRGYSSFRTYVLAAVHNRCIDIRRRRVSKSGRLREINPTTTAFFRRLPAGSRFLGVSTQVQRRESQQIVRAAIAELPERQQACMVLHDLEGLPYREVAEVLDTTINNVGVLLYKGRRRLRELIEEGDVFGDA
jgi:RNA polymerase sigma-70 factor (ECF subfamily)